MKTYNVGEIVVIHKLEWFEHLYGKSIDSDNFLISDNIWFNIEGMSKYCGIQTKIVGIFGVNRYLLKCDSGDWVWSNDMFEGIKEIRKKKLEKLYEV